MPLNVRGLPPRKASHAGSWYSDDGEELALELQEWLDASKIAVSSKTRAIIAPHAGYKYSGRCAAFAFGHIDPSTVKRIFLLGPSHHHFTRKCALSRLSLLSTPIGDIEVDQSVYTDLRASGKFEEMSVDVDEAEHSMEMHLPYLCHVMKGHAFTLVPILVGALSPESEAEYGALLAKYLTDPTTLFSVSSDFCHWGARFKYTHHDKRVGPIHKSIEAVDHAGMALIEEGEPEAFTKYLEESENTICGRHPIGVLLQMMKYSSLKFTTKFVHYEQSSKCLSTRDSSVSYASAVVTEHE